MPYIFFRSHIGRIDTSGSSNSLRYGRGFDWDTLRLYTPWDNTRDIAWMKSWIETFIRNRTETENFPIYILEDVGTENEFFTNTHPISKNEFTKEFIRVCHESAKKYGHPFKGKLQKNEEIKNAMIFIVSSTLDMQDVWFIKKFSLFNDVIFLHILHPFEKNPDKTILFSFKKIKVQQYVEQFEKRKEEIRKFIIKNWCSYVDIYTHESIYDKLNFFFKNRYKHG